MVVSDDVVAGLPVNRIGQSERCRAHAPRGPSQDRAGESNPARCPELLRILLAH